MFYIYACDVDEMRATEFESGGCANSALKVSCGDQRVDLYFRDEMLLAPETIARVFDVFKDEAPLEMVALLRSVLALIDERSADAISDVRSRINDVEALLAELQQMDVAE